MIFKVKDLEVKPVRFEIAYQPGEIDFLQGTEGDSLRMAGPLETAGIAEWIASVGEIRVRGRMRVTMESDCDRCLEAAHSPVELQFDLFYRPMSTLQDAEEVGLSDSESEMGFFEGEGLALADLLREQILLALPVQRLCRPDCKGLCRVCGVNRNRQDCSCAVTPVDNRWAAALKSVKVEK